ncbi:MAG: succinylglutamate desuccinylase/aspartoacylase family protein, partial [Candidatus Hodarchaeota archaeon]
KGMKTHGKIKVTTLSSGLDLELPVYLISGATEGPKIVLLHGLHGDEFQLLTALRKLGDSITPKDLSGMLIIVPVANPLAFQSGTRHTPVDMLDLNRSFPGVQQGGQLTEKIASVLTEELLKNSDYILDFHSGDSSSVLDLMIAPDVGGKIQGEINELAEVFGLKVINRSKAYYGTATTYAASELGIPSLVPELGGSGFGALMEELWTNKTIKCIKNVLVHLGMLDGEVVKPQNQITVRSIILLRASNGGILIPTIGVDKLGEFVKEGELLAEIINPYSFEILEQIMVPKDSVCCGLRSMAPINLSERYCYILADLASRV